MSLMESVLPFIIRIQRLCFLSYSQHIKHANTYFQENEGHLSGLINGAGKNATTKFIQFLTLYG